VSWKSYPSALGLVVLLAALTVAGEQSSGVNETQAEDPAQVIAKLRAENDALKRENAKLAKEKASLDQDLADTSEIVKLLQENRAMEKALLETKQKLLEKANKALKEQAKAYADEFVKMLKVIAEQEKELKRLRDKYEPSPEKDKGSPPGADKEKGDGSKATP